MTTQCKTAEDFNKLFVSAVKKNPFERLLCKSAEDFNKLFLMGIN